MQKQALHKAKTLKSDSLSKRKRKKLNQEIHQIHLDIKKFEARRQALLIKEDENNIYTKMQKQDLGGKINCIKLPDGTLTTDKKINCRNTR